MYSVDNFTDESDILDSNIRSTVSPFMSNKMSLEPRMSYRIPSKKDDIMNLNENNNNKNLILFPHHSNLNNLKTNKYFSTISSGSDLMKEALQNYRTKSISKNFQNQNELLQITNSSISTLSATKKITKNIQKTKTKTYLNKLAPKLLHIASKIT